MIILSLWMSTRGKVGSFTFASARSYLRDKNMKKLRSRKSKDVSGTICVDVGACVKEKKMIGLKYRV